MDLLAKLALAVAALVVLVWLFLRIPALMVGMFVLFTVAWAVCRICPDTSGI